MKQIEVIEQIAHTIAVCNQKSCENCPHLSACVEVFGSQFASKAILELAKKCKAFNEFARANTERRKQS